MNDRELSFFAKTAFAITPADAVPEGALEVCR